MLFIALPLVVLSQSWQHYDSLRVLQLEKRNCDSSLYFAEKALKMVKLKYGEGDTLFADMLLGVFDAHVCSQNFKQAILTGELEVANRRKVQGENNQEYRDILNNLAKLYWQTGDLVKAFELCNEVVNNVVRYLGKEHPEYGNNVNNLAALFYHVEKYDTAIILFQEALENCEKTLGKEHKEYGIRLNNLALLYQNTCQFEKALPLYFQAIENTEKALGRDDPEYGLRLNNLGLIYKQMGWYEKALAPGIESLENCEKSLGKKHTEYGRRLSNLASTYEMLGQYNKALPLFIEALTNCENALGKNHATYAMRLRSLAGLYRNMGQYNRALSLYEEALIITEQTQGKAHSLYGTSLNSIANVYLQLGMYDKSILLFKESVENAEISLGKNHSGYGLRLNNLANAYRLSGDYDKALPLYLTALENCEKVLGKAHSQYGVFLNGLALLYENKKEYEQAEKVFLESLENCAQSMGKDHPEYGIRLNNLAFLYEKTGQYERALPLYKEALNNNRNNINRAFSYLAENEKADFIKSLSQYFEGYRRFIKNYSKVNPIVASEAYDIEIMTKGIILQSGIQMRQTIINSNNPNALKIYDNWLSDCKTLAQQYSLPVEKRIKEIKEIEKRVELNERELAKLSTGFKRAIGISQIKWQDIQASLKNGEAAIEFSAFNDSYNNKGNPDSIMYMAIIVKKKSEHPLIIPLFYEKDLQRIINKPVKNTANYISNLYGSNYDLYNLIWKPTEELLNDINTVFISPSSLLHKISFSAISDSNNVLLCDKYNINLVSSTALLSEKKPELTEIKTALLYGGIEYSNSEKGDDTWQYLEGTMKEGEILSKRLKKYDVSYTLYTGLNATETSFKESAGKNNLLHIASHGFFYPEYYNTNNEIIIEKTDEFVFRGSGSYGNTMFVQSSNPMLRSGLVFAGANNFWAGDENPEGDDGILTSLEVAQINFTNTDLVVLSACETGLGDIKGSEGVYGLQRAFKMAGVKYIIMSLWQVPDKETVEFMEMFYTKLIKQKDIRSAFNDTQKVMRGKYDPYYWGAFVLVE